MILWFHYLFPWWSSLGLISWHSDRLAWQFIVLINVWKVIDVSMRKSYTLEFLFCNSLIFNLCPLLWDLQWDLVIYGPSMSLLKSWRYANVLRPHLRSFLSLWGDIHFSFVSLSSLLSFLSRIHDIQALTCFLSPRVHLWIKNN